MQVRFQAYTTKFRIPMNRDMEEKIQRLSADLKLGSDEVLFDFTNGNDEMEVGVVSGEELVFVQAALEEMKETKQALYHSAKLMPGQNPILDQRVEVAIALWRDAIGAVLKSRPKDKPQPRLRLVKSV